MRLGAYDCKLQKGSLSEVAYRSQLTDNRKEKISERSTVNGKTLDDFVVQERHRHRYEFNNEYRETLEKKGLTVAGTSPNGKLVEIVEIKKHPFFVGTQFHPEFLSRPLRPHPLFMEFINQAKK